MGKGWAAIVEVMCGKLPESQVRVWAERKTGAREAPQELSSTTLTAREAATDLEMRTLLGILESADEKSA